MKLSIATGSCPFLPLGADLDGGVGLGPGDEGQAGLAVESQVDLDRPFLGLRHRYGRIAPGFDADLVALNGELQVLKTWIAGEPDARPIP